MNTLVKIQGQRESKRKGTELVVDSLIAELEELLICWEYGQEQVGLLEVHRSHVVILSYDQHDGFKCLHPELVMPDPLAEPLQVQDGSGVSSPFGDGQRISINPPPTHRDRFYGSYLEKVGHGSQGVLLLMP